MQLHVGGDDLPPGRRRRARQAGRPARSSRAVLLRRCARPRRAGAPGHGGRHRRAAPLRLDRGPGRHVQPTCRPGRSTAPHRRRRAAGRRDPHPGDDGRLCATGVPGEIEVRTWQRAVGYFGDAERTAATFTDDGWVRSGDLGVIDERGALSIVGRKKEIIIRGGLNITPREIEEHAARVRRGRTVRRHRPAGRASR